MIVIVTVIHTEYILVNIDLDFVIIFKHLILTLLIKSIYFLLQI